MTDQGNAGGPPQPEAPGQQLPTQEQMAAAIQTLEKRIQRLRKIASDKKKYQPNVSICHRLIFLTGRLPSYKRVIL